MNALNDGEEWTNIDESPFDFGNWTHRVVPNGTKKNNAYLEGSLIMDSAGEWMAAGAATLSSQNCDCVACKRSKSDVILA